MLLLFATHNQIVRKILKSKQEIKFCYHKNIYELQKCKNNCTCPYDPSEFGWTHPMGSLSWGRSWWRWKTNILATHKQTVSKYSKKKQFKILKLQKCKNNCTCPYDPSEFGWTHPMGSLSWGSRSWCFRRRWWWTNILRRRKLGIAFLLTKQPNEYNSFALSNSQLSTT